MAYGESVKCKFFRRAGFYQRLYARAWGLKRPRNGDLITRSRYLYNLGNSISPREKRRLRRANVVAGCRENFVRARCDLRRATMTIRNIYARISRDFTSSEGYVQLKKKKKKKKRKHSPRRE